MIYDTIDNIGRYRGLKKGLDVLIDWLGGNDFRALPTGRTDILGDKVYANVMEATTRPVEDARHESHRRYLDVQVDVHGREAFKVGQGDALGRTEFNEADDYDLLDTTLAVDGNLDKGRFAIFMAGEPHMPTLQFGDDGAQPVRKICFKVLDDPFFD